MDGQLKKTIQVNPDFLKLPMRGGRSRKNKTDAAEKVPKPIKIRSEKKTDSDKTIKRRAINYIRKQQEDRYKRLMKGVDEPGALEEVRVESTDPKKTYADNFTSDFDESLSFLQKLADQNSQKINTSNNTLKQYPIITNSTLFNDSTLNAVLGNPISSSALQAAHLVEPVLRPSLVNASSSGAMELSSGAMALSSGAMALSRFTLPPPPAYGCLKGGRLPTYRTQKNAQALESPSSGPAIMSGGSNSSQRNSSISLADPFQGGKGLSSVDSRSLTDSKGLSQVGSSNLSVDSRRLSQVDSRSLSQVDSRSLSQVDSRSLSKLSPEQQRAELKQFIEKRKEEKHRIERVKKQRNALNPGKKQKRTTTRTFRVGKSKHYPRVGVLIPNKTIRTQILAKKQTIRETSIEDVRRYLIKKGLIRVGSSCPNDVLRKMHESAMMMCGEIQNHNPDNLLYNYLHNAI